jgi:GNAT superfamily N-acetyltransferase
VEVLLGPEPLVEAVLRDLPPARARRTTRMVLAVSSDGMPMPAPGTPVRRATPSDLLGLVDLYEGYEFDGYPTRRHLHRALEERIREAAVYVIELDGRPVAARRIDASSPEVALLGGLTVHPDYRGRGLGRDVRLGSSRDLLARGVPHCTLRDRANPYMPDYELRDHAPWTVANLTSPPPAAWADMVNRVRARISPWDRPCRRRRAGFAASVQD